MSKQPVDNSDVVTQLLSVLDKLPFVSGLKRDVQSLREVIHNRRPPRVAALGWSESGRTSLANALLGRSALPVDKVVGAPKNPTGEDTVLKHEGQWLRVEVDGAVLDWLEVTLVRDGTDEAALRLVAAEAPDVVMFVLPASEADAAAELIAQAKAMMARIVGRHDGLPAVVPVLSRADAQQQGAPSFDDASRAAVDLARLRFENELESAGVQSDVVSVSVPNHGESLGLGALTAALFAKLPNEAKLEGARVLQHATEGRRAVANGIVHSCSTLALTIGLAPIPLSDVAIIAPLQIVMVSAIAHLGGRAWNRKAAAEWIMSVGVVGGAGLGLRWAAQQLAKLIPGAGTLVSAGVAGAGTVTLGQSAIAYFLRDSETGQLPREAAA